MVISVFSPTIFSRELQDILENEKFEIVERERIAKEKADEVYLSKSFVEHLNGHQLFESLFIDDPDGEALLAIGEDAVELKNEYDYAIFIPRFVMTVNYNSSGI